MSRQSDARIGSRHWWQRYPMFGLAAGWVLIGAVMAAGVSQMHVL